MKVLRAILEEVVGLFVDDWAFAGLILLWVGLIALVLHRALGVLGGPALFAGLAGIVLVFVARRARH